MNLDTKQRIRRGREAFERRDYVAALSDFQVVLEAHPGFADIRHLSGLCLSFLGEAEAALEEFERAVELNENYVEAQLHRAITLTELGRYDEAREAFERARAADADAPGRFPAVVSARLANAHADVGDLYMQAGAPSEAAAQYRAATDLRPAFLDIRHKLAQALLQVGELEAAADELEAALEANPKFLEARMTLGLTHYRRDDVEAAARQWEQCRTQAPEHPQLRGYFALLEREPAPHDPSDEN